MNAWAAKQWVVSAMCGRATENGAGLQDRGGKKRERDREATISAKIERTELTVAMGSKLNSTSQLTN